MFSQNNQSPQVVIWIWFSLFLFDKQAFYLGKAATTTTKICDLLLSELWERERRRLKWGCLVLLFDAYNYISLPRKPTFTFHFFFSLLFLALPFSLGQIMCHRDSCFGVPLVSPFVISACFYWLLPTPFFF